MLSSKIEAYFGEIIQLIEKGKASKALPILKSAHKNLKDGLFQNIIKNLLYHFQATEKIDYWLDFFILVTANKIIIRHYEQAIFLLILTKHISDAKEIKKINQILENLYETDSRKLGFTLMQSFNEYFLQKKMLKIF